MYSLIRELTNLKKMILYITNERGILQKWKYIMIKCKDKIKLYNVSSDYILELSDKEREKWNIKNQVKYNLGNIEMK